MKRLLLAAALTALASQAIHAGSFDINLSDDAVRAVYVSRFENGGVELDLGLLHHEDNGDVGSIGLHVTDFAGSGASRLRIGVGGKLFYFDSDTADGGALGLGGYVSFRPRPAGRAVVSGHAYWAPEVVSFDDTEDYFEAGARIGYRLIQRAEVYLGVRTVRADFEDTPSVTFDSGLHFGLRLSF